MERDSNQLKLRVVLPNNDDKLVTDTPPVLEAPSWALNQQLSGRRDYSRVFRLPNENLWIRKWVYSRISPTEYIPQSAMDNSTTESTTVFRCLPNDRLVIPKMSCHWLLCPFQSFNGYTVGLAYMDVTLNYLDDSCVHPVHVGRFAMDEASGEVFVTAWHSNKHAYMTVGWTASVSSCERVRELFLFECPAVDGNAPTNLLLQNSFYERRNCHICKSPNTPVCNAPASRSNTTNSHRSSSSSTGAYLYPLRNVYRRFRGCYFGVCVKTKYVHHQINQPPVRTVSAERIVCDIRHGIASVSRRLRMNLSYGSFSFGTDPLVIANRILAIDTRRRISAKCIETNSNAESSEISCEEAASSHSIGAGAGAGAGVANKNVNVGDENVKRRRNSDTVFDRDTARHRRKLRNRESAKRSNANRKLRLQNTEQELDELREKLPKLQQRHRELQNENFQLRQCLSNKDKPTITPGDCIDIDRVFGFHDPDSFF